MAEKFPGRSIFGGLSINFRCFTSKPPSNLEDTVDGLRISGLSSFTGENLQKRVYLTLRLFAWWLQPQHVLGCWRVPNPQGPHLCSDVVVKLSSENIRELVYAHKTNYEKFFNGTVQFNREKAVFHKIRRQ